MLFSTIFQLYHESVLLVEKKEKQRKVELPLQNNSGCHSTPLFWFLGFHGNGSKLES